MNQSELDDVVALVSERTGRNVSLDDVAGRVLAYSTIVSTTDQVRIDAVLSKEVPSNARSWEASHGVTSRTRAFLVPGNVATGFLPRVCIPLLVRGVRVGYLWVQANSHDDVLTGVLDDLTRWQRGIEHLAERVLVALGTSATSTSEADHDLQNLLQGLGEEVPQELAARIPPGGDTRVVVFTGAEPGRAGSSLPSLAYSQAVRDASRASGFEVVQFADDQHGVFLLPGLELAAPFMERLSHALHLRTTAEREPTVPYGVSAPLLRVTDCRVGYRQAVVALQAAAVDPGVAGRSYEACGIYQILSQSGSAQLPQRIFLLQQAADGEEKLRLLERIYDSPGPMQRIADGLHMHRTSIYNHLNRIERIIGADPLHPQVRLELHAGLKLLRWFERPRFRAPGSTASTPPVY